MKLLFTSSFVVFIVLVVIISSLSYRAKDYGCMCEGFTCVSSRGVEELGHLEMIGTMVHQLTRNLTEKEIEQNPGFAAYFVDHTAGVYPTSASGSPWNAAGMAVKGDTIADLNENLAAEQKARVTYDNILRLVDDPDIIEPIKFLREREIVHYQRFGDTLPQSCKLFS